MNATITDSPADLVANAISLSGRICDWIGERVDSLSIPADDKTRLSGASFHIALTHHVSIATLVRDGRTASAFALLRPQIDGYVRGLWFSTIATEKEIAGVRNGDDPPATRKLMERLETEGYFHPDTFATIGVKIWPTVCDYTHTGIRLLVNHLNATEVAPSFEPEDIVEVLEASNAWAYMAAIGLAGLANNDDLAIRLLNHAKTTLND